MGGGKGLSLFSRSRAGDAVFFFVSVGAVIFSVFCLFVLLFFIFFKFNH